jgi:energy-coupling factor transporter ATP-binding protein EcfA2
VYVKNLRIYAKHLRRDLAERPEGLPDPAHERLLLQEANGGGKSTILEAIATLWDPFGEWIDAGPGRRISASSRSVKHYFVDADLAAVELKGLFPDGPSLWLGMGKIQYWVDLKDEHPTAQFAGLVQSKGSWEVQLPSGDWTSFRQSSMLGTEPHANVVYIPAGRTTHGGAGRAPQIIDVTPFGWLARYCRSVHLASLLRTVAAKEPAKYDEALRVINAALGNQRKNISELGPHGMVVKGETNFGQPYEHLIGGLSSGEKQMLLLIGFITATLRPGGIVIVDDPDLHVHIGMVQQLLGSIDAIAKERGGQLIVASHSEQVWDWFSRDSEKISLSPCVEGGNDHTSDY